MTNHTPTGERIDEHVAVIAIGGFDPSGGAGVVRDFLTGRTLGASVRLIPTAWTEQDQGGVHAVEPREPAALKRAIRNALTAAEPSRDERGASRAAHLADRFGVRTVVKIGMLPDAHAINAVLDGLDGFTGPVIFDPVLRASSGGALYNGDPTALLALGVRANLMTPNAPETEVLAGSPVRNPDDAVAAGRALCARGVPAVLVKGGHLQGAHAVDVLVTGSEVRRFSAARLPGPSVRGTGCALGSAIAVGIGRGLALGDAIAWARAWLLAAIPGAIDIGGQHHLS